MHNSDNYNKAQEILRKAEAKGKARAENKMKDKKKSSMLESVISEMMTAYEARRQKAMFDKMNRDGNEKRQKNMSLADKEKQERRNKAISKLAKDVNKENVNEEQTLKTLSSMKTMTKEAMKDIEKAVSHAFDRLLTDEKMGDKEAREAINDKLRSLM